MPRKKSASLQSNPKSPGFHIDIPTPHFDVPTPHFDIPPPHFDIPPPHFDVPPPHFDVPPPHFDVPPPHFDVPPPHFDIPPPHFDIPPPHFDIPPPHFDIQHPHFDIQHPHFDVPPPHFDVPPPHFDVPRPHFDLPPLHADIPHLHADIPHFHVDIPRPHIDVPRPHIDVPLPHFDLPRPHADFAAHVDLGKSHKGVSSGKQSPETGDEGTLSEGLTQHVGSALDGLAGSMAERDDYHASAMHNLASSIAEQDVWQQQIAQALAELSQTVAEQIGHIAHTSMTTLTRGDALHASANEGLALSMAQQDMLHQHVEHAVSQLAHGVSEISGNLAGAVTSSLAQMEARIQYLEGVVSELQTRLNKPANKPAKDAAPKRRRSPK